MITSPDAVYLIIPAMKELGMSWSEIKQTPREELMGLVAALGQYEVLHSYDGYSSNDINEMAKNNTGIRSQYNKYLETKASYEARANMKRKKLSFKDDLDI